jgi:hypothetical protein
MRLVGVWTVLVFCAQAAASPFCEGGPDGENRVRTAVFDDRFGPHLGAVGLPFALVLAGIAVWHFYPSRRTTEEGGTHGPTA